jgi:tRNA(Ile)-lysidine synthase
VEKALELLRGEGDRQVELRAGLVARRRGGELEVVAGRGRGAGEPAPAPPEEVLVPGPGRYRLDPPGLELVVAVEGGAAVTWPLSLRTRRPGDRFRPAGGRGGKTLKAWLIDRKVARERRDALWLVTDAGGRVLAIPELGALAEGAAGLSLRIEPGPR